MGREGDEATLPTSAGVAACTTGACTGPGSETALESSAKHLVAGSRTARRAHAQSRFRRFRKILLLT